MNARGSDDTAMTTDRRKIRSDSDLLSDPLFDEAAALYLRARDAGQGSASSLRAVERWAGQSSARLHAVARLKTLWESVGEIEDLPWPTWEELTADTSEEGDADRRRAGAAAGPLWRYEAVRRVAAGFAVVVMLGFAGYGYFVTTTGPNTPPSSRADYATVVGEHQDITLSDGSRFTLGGKSAAQTRYSPTERVVVLQTGEAFFDVETDPSRPFSVVVGDTRVRAVGTSFNVWTNGRDVTVSVVDGTVTVIDELAAPQRLPDRRNGGEAIGRSGVELTRGQQIRYARTVGTSPIERADVESVIAWRHRNLVFRGAPLQRVISDVNRYRTQTIRIADPAVGAMKFSGTVQPDRVADWLQGLPRVFPVEVVMQSDGAVVLRATVSDSQNR